MRQQVGCDQIAQDLLEQYPNTDAYGIAQELGLWLRPQLRCKTELRGRVVLFDVTLPPVARETEVLRCAAQFVAQRATRLERLAAPSEHDATETEESLEAS